MSVRATPWKPERLRHHWMVDIRFKDPTGKKTRDRTVHEAPTITQAKRYGEAREAQLRAGTLTLNVGKTDVVTIAEFAPDWIEKHHKASLHKASGVDSAETILRVHIVPFIGGLSLDKVTDEVVANLRAKWIAGGYTSKATATSRERIIKGTNSRKTIANRLSVLSSMLNTAVNWKRLAALPCRIKLPKVDTQRAPDFHEHDVYERLVDGARACGPKVYALILLAGDGGLRRGEIIGLNQSDVDFKRGRFTPRRSVFWKKRVR